MNRILSVGFLFFLLASGQAARAAPSWSYNFNTGGVSIKNDTGMTLSVVYMLSPQNVFTTNASAYAAIPGTFLDTGDLPYGFTYLNFPAGEYQIGSIAPPHGFNCGLQFDFKLGYFRNFGTTPEEFGVGPICPEPGGTMLAGAGLLGLAARRRVPRSQCL